jgi:hypothetical protein
MISVIADIREMTIMKEIIRNVSGAIIAIVRNLDLNTQPHKGF